MMIFTILQVLSSLEIIETTFRTARSTVLYDVLPRVVSGEPIYKKTISTDVPHSSHAFAIECLFKRYDSRISLFALFRSTALLKLRVTENPAMILVGLTALRV